MSIINENLLNKISPFYIHVDSKGVLRQVGHSIKKVFPSIATDQYFDKYFEVITPHPLANHELIHQEDIMVLKINNKTEMRLKMLPLKFSDDMLVFIGHPYITESFSFQYYGLTIADLPPQDAVIEYLFLHKAMKNSLAEVEESKSILAQKNEELEALLIELRQRNEEYTLRTKYMSVILKSTGVRELCKELLASFFDDCKLSFAGIYIFSMDKSDLFSHLITESKIPNEKREELAVEFIEIATKLHESPNGFIDQTVNCDTYNTPIRAISVTRNNGINDGYVLMGRTEPTIPPAWKLNLISEVARVMSVKLIELRAERKMIDLNLTLQKEVEKRVAELTGINKNLESFAYSISHDLKAPIRHISLATSSLKNLLASITTNQEAERYFELIGNATRKMSNLIDSLLHFSRIGVMGLNKSTFSLRPLVEEILINQKTLYPSQKILTKINLPDELHGDRQLISQVFENLISNAVKYSSKMPESIITINYTENPKFYEFTVSDNGIGFDKSFENKLFLPFHRLHTTEQFEGIGIGLANVKRIIERHNGTIMAKSDIGKGATFIFTILKN